MKPKDAVPPKEKDAYSPIHCGFHDVLESTAVRRVICKIIFQEETGAVRTETTRISDVYSSGGEEFVLLESGSKIRLDKIQSVDGAVNPR